jgi:hypothetical protein
LNPLRPKDPDEIPLGEGDGKGFEEASTVVRTLIQIGDEERRSNVGQPLPPRVASRRVSTWWPGCSQSDFVQQALDECPELGIRSSPLPAYVRTDSLIKMSTRNRQSKPI